MSSRWFDQLLVHRISWELANGAIPDGLWVLHHCDNPPCVRPDHLFLGTNGDNIRDMLRKGRQSRVGSRNPFAKLTEEQVAAILRAHRDGESVRELAQRFGVKWTAIHNIVTRRTWRHVAV